jgi:hypothetical protein
MSVSVCTWTSRPVPGWLALVGILMSGPAFAQESSPRASRGATAGRAGSSPPASSALPAPTLPHPAGPGGPAALTPPGTTPLPDGAEDRSLPANPPGPVGRLGGILPLPTPAVGVAETPPGMAPAGRRPQPGSLFDPGASGPGISQGAENFLDGALDPRTGWPFVLLDHFAPRPDRVQRFWVVNTRECPQVMGTDPWPCLKVRRFDARGELVEVDPSVLMTQTVGHPVLIQVQGSLTTPDVALGGLLWTHSWLQWNRALLPDTVVIAFDWPSQRVYRNDIRDVNEKGRRAYIAAYHLARFVQGFPPDNRICLLGQSYGGRVVTSALHLLGGGSLNSQSHDPWIRLPGLRAENHVRAIILVAASDHTWLDPANRLDRSLHGCEGLLNLYNRKDEALALYPLLFRSNHHRALGRVGLTHRDLARLGPLAARYNERDVNRFLGDEHTLLDAVANPEIGRMMAPYLWAPDPGPSPPVAAGPSRRGILARVIGNRFGLRVPGLTGTAK